MSHQVLARKWRPQTFADMAGQQHVLQALANALDQQRLHHAYLLTGTRGVGKTTIARILARCLNCDQGVGSEPCGSCSSCVEISEGRSIDLIEVDAASKTKVEDTRELLENVQFAPSAARYKVYLIDEVHMLSNSSFNALLKTLEEPPPHAVFVLATTHPQKIPATVLSRCLQFHLRNLAEPIIVERLQMIIEAENISADETALLMLARAAAGSMRDALTLLEQASAFGNGTIDADQVRDMLGVIDAEVLLGLCDAVVEGDAATALDIVASYTERAADNTALVDDMLVLFHRAAVEQAVPGAGSEAQLHAAAIRRYAQTLGAEDLQLYYQVLLLGKRDLALAPDPRSGLEMLVLRLLAFQPLPAGLVGQAAGTGATESRPPDALKKKPPATSAVTAAVRPDVQQPAATAKRTEVERPELVEPATPAENSASQSHAPEAGGPGFMPQQLDSARWCEIFGTLPLSGMVRAIAENMLPIDARHQSGRLVFGMLNKDALMYKPAHDARIADALSIYFGARLEVEVARADAWQDLQLQAEAVETPAQHRARLADERQQNAVESLRDDKGAQALIEAFDASIDYGSVKPLSAADESGQSQVDLAAVSEKQH